MDTETWFARLDELLPPVAPERLVLTDEERAALLDLARVAAHTSERWAAPVTTYLVGIAQATTPPAERAAAIRAIADALEHGEAPGDDAPRP